MTLAFLLGGCGGSSPPVVRGNADVPLTVDDPAACHSAHLRVALEMENEAMLHLRAVYVVSAVGPGRCTLAGFPRVSVFHDTSLRPTASERVGANVVRQGQAGAVSIHGQRRAGFVISYIADGSRPCPRSEFAVALPGMTRRIILPSVESFPVCLGGFQASQELDVSSVEPYWLIPHPDPKPPAYEGSQ
jgi:hypothetical protein